MNPMLHLRPTKISLLALAFVVYNQSIHANTLIPSGSNTTYGGFSSFHSIFSHMANPAKPASHTILQSRYGTGMAGTVILESNDVDTVVDAFDDAKSTLNGDVDFSTIDQVLSPVNQALSTSANAFYAKNNINVALPVAVANPQWGGIGFYVENTAQSRASILNKKGFQTDAIAISAIVEKQVQGLEITDDEIVDTLLTDSGLYLKYANQTEVGLTYSRYLTSILQGDVFIGARPKIINTTLGKQVIGLRKYLSSSDNSSDVAQSDIDAIQDAATTSSALSLDVGAVWQTPNVTLGAMMYNITAPEFDYNPIPHQAQCANINDANQQSNCYLANYYRDQIALNETYVMMPLLRMEGAIHNANQSLVAAGSLDLNPVADFSGDEYQWLSVHMAYATEADFTTDDDQFDPRALLRMLIPDVRLGLQHNLTGNDITVLVLGSTFGPLSLDLALDQNTLDLLMGNDTGTPEYFVASLSVEAYF